MNDSGNEIMVSTTTLFVELLVIGIGALVWMSLAAAALFGYRWLDEGLLSSPLLIPPLLALAYVLGSIVDRLADRLFEHRDTRFQRRIFGSRRAYARARTWVYEWSVIARDNFEYSKSRIRVCRGWTLNAAILFLVANLFVAFSGIDPALQGRLALFLSLFSASLAVGAAASWQSLSASRYHRLKYYYERLCRDRGRDPAGLLADVPDPCQEEEA